MSGDPFRVDAGHRAVPPPTEAGPIVCVGAHMQGLFMHVERIPQEGESVRGWGFREPLDGGKVANVAVAAARLGAPVRLVTVVGTDERSDRWRAYFGEQGIDTRGMLQHEGPMDVGPALLPPSKVPAVISVGDMSARLVAAVVERQAELFRDASVVVCALESPVDGVEAAFRLGRENGATTLLNPSPVARLSEDLVALVDVLVANEQEAEVLSDGIDDPGKAAATIQARLPLPTVIVTAGERGAFVVEGGGGAAHVPATRIHEVVDTTGAGDAFLGALAAHLSVGTGLAPSVDASVRAASISCTREHTMPSFPTAEELDAFERA
jgi:ribokinase